MTFNKSLVATLLSAAICLPAMADTGGFSKAVYVGISGGVSGLEPESQVPQFFVQDDTDSGTKVYIGYDISPRWAAELSFADLGEAVIGPDSVGSISYQVLELSGLYRLFDKNRRGFGAFAKLGFGGLDNESDLNFTRDNDLHLSGGLGVEWASKFGLAVRGEIEAFDQDATFASLGLLWRFGGGSSSSSDSDDSGLFSKGVGSVGGLLDGESDLATLDDDDNDGVPNSLDDCAGTESGAPVSATGCAVFGGVLEGVQFESGSDVLVDAAQVVLNGAADVLLKDPNLKVEVQAHTDSQGAEEFNIELSKKRALATVRYLMLRGVPSEQMTARAFGESKPIADNTTAAGRSTNRRVEFHVIER